MEGDGSVRTRTVRVADIGTMPRGMYYEQYIHVKGLIHAAVRWIGCLMPHTPHSRTPRICAT